MIFGSTDNAKLTEHDRLFQKAHSMFNDAETRDRKMAEEIKALRNEVKALREMCSLHRYKLVPYGSGLVDLPPLTAIKGVELLMAHLGLELQDEPAKDARLTLIPTKKAKK